MNTTHQEPLFTDLTPKQAETIAAAGLSQARAPYGEATASIRGGLRSFSVSELNVEDLLRDGRSVYAKIQGMTPSGQILTSSTKRFDRNGSARPGTRYTGLRGAFSSNVSQYRVAVYLTQRGRDAVAPGNWIPLEEDDDSVSSL